MHGGLANYTFSSNKKAVQGAAVSVAKVEMCRLTSQWLSVPNCHLYWERNLSSTSVFGKL